MGQPLEQDYQQIQDELNQESPPNNDAILAMRSELTEQKKNLNNYKEDLKHVNSTLVAGVIVLLVMVATLMAMMLISYIEHYTNNTDANIRTQDSLNLDKRLQRLEDRLFPTNFPSPSIPTPTQTTG